MPKRTTIKRERIVCSKELRLEMIQKFKVSAVTLYQAWAFFLNSPRARELRQYTLDNGGKIISEDVVI